MGLHVKKLEEVCSCCGESKVEVHMKSPFIDDFLTGCGNFSCSKYEDMASHLRGFARMEARREGE